MQVPPQLLVLSMHDDAVSQQARISRGMSLKYLSTNQHVIHQHAPVALHSSCDTLLGCWTMVVMPLVRIQKSCYGLARDAHTICNYCHSCIASASVLLSATIILSSQPLPQPSRHYTSSHFPQPTTRSGLARHFFLDLSERRHSRETRKVATTAGRIEYTLGPIGAVRYADRQKLFITALSTLINTTALFS
jgi:hypothetical protein